MSDAIDRLRAKIESAQQGMNLSRVWVPPHESVTADGHPYHVRGYWRRTGGGGTVQEPVREPTPAALEVPKATKHAPDVKSPEWRRITEEIHAQGAGNCYQAAMTLLLAAEHLGLKHPIIVQAMVKGQGDLAGTYIGHSWVEADGQTIQFPNPSGGEPMTMEVRYAYDWSSGKMTVMDSHMYTYLASPRVVHEYTPEEAMKMAVRTKTYGPWTDDVVVQESA